MNSRNKSVRRRRKPVAGAASSPAGAPNFLPIPGAPDIRCATRVEAWCRTRPSLWSAAIAQLVEHVIRNDGVGGSSPSCGTDLTLLGFWLSEHSKIPSVWLPGKHRVSSSLEGASGLYAPSLLVTARCCHRGPVRTASFVAVESSAVRHQVLRHHARLPADVGWRGATKQAPRTDMPDRDDHLLGFAPSLERRETLPIKRLPDAEAKEVAARNVERVREYFRDHPGCRYKEAATALNLSIDQTRRSVQKIRAEWKHRR